MKIMKSQLDGQTTQIKAIKQELKFVKVQMQKQLKIKDRELQRLK